MEKEMEHDMETGVEGLGFRIAVQERNLSFHIVGV